jgi:hypothetical protein
MAEHRDGWDEFDRKRVDSYAAQKATAEAALKRIDQDGMRFYEAIGDEPMREVTDRMRQETLERIQLFEELILSWTRMAERTRLAD